MAVAEAAESEEADREDEEEVRLPEPDFDELEHMQEEVEKGKLAVMNTGYGIFLAAVTVLVQSLYTVDWKIGWLVLLAGASFLRYVYRMGGVRSHEWGAKEWLARYVTLFFTYLAFWYIFSNPPFV
jgi:hypothetical protein